jgi:predicted DNA-binding transcriptional regulator AlpA
MQAIDELASVVGVRAACQALGVPRSTYYRAHQPPQLPRISPLRRPHPRALSSDEQAAVRAQLNSERFGDRAPRTILCNAAG